MRSPRDAAGQGARQVGVGTLVAAPILALIGARRRISFLGAVCDGGHGMLVSVAIIAVFLAATWLPTRRCCA